MDEVDACPVVVVDDHPGARRALAGVVAATPGLRLTASLNSGESAVAHLVVATAPVLVVMDVRMPGLGGAEAAARIADLGRGHVVVLVSADDDVGLLLADRPGVAFVSKSRLTGRRLLEAWHAR
ncbi:response regulator [Blastococcus mobilis]|uniref:Response regulator receiver domain-containing protein n=1 Tax=Blastococcus mobilis TaxID=1938746 RepID=A0A238ZBU3_9ACTN|nr:response regulator [Blastococcus mobilis]SNR80552.1 Response regulator receiver domain-containing protein [Blastococcus mobilis]